MKAGFAFVCVRLGIVNGHGEVNAFRSAMKTKERRRFDPNSQSGSPALLLLPAFLRIFRRVHAVLAAGNADLATDPWKLLKEIRNESVAPVSLLSGLGKLLDEDWCRIGSSGSVRVGAKPDTLSSARVLSAAV